MPVQIFCVGPKIYLHIVPVTNILCQTKRWFAFSNIVFCAGTKVFEEALNAVKFLGWLTKFGPAQNILQPVKGQGTKKHISNGGTFNLDHNPKRAHWTLITFQKELISLWSYSQKSISHFEHISKRTHFVSITLHFGYIPKRANFLWAHYILALNKKSTLQRGHIPFRSHSKKSKFNFDHIPKRANSILSTFWVDSKKNKLQGGIIPFWSHFYKSTFNFYPISKRAHSILSTFQKNPHSKKAHSVSLTFQKKYILVWTIIFQTQNCWFQGSWFYLVHIFWEGH